MVIKHPVQVGESCWLASGGPRMSAVGIADGHVIVEWPNEDGDILRAEFPDASLSNIDPKTFQPEEWNDRVIAK